MRVVVRLSLCLPLCALLCACARDNIAGPAKTISGQLASFQADLSAFQTDLGQQQANQHAASTGSDARTAASRAATREYQAEWALRQAKSSQDQFAILQKQGNDEGARALSDDTSVPPASAKFDLDGIAKTAKGLSGLASPASQKEKIDFLIAYGKSVNAQLQTVEKASQDAPASGQKKK